MQSELKSGDKISNLYKVKESIDIPAGSFARVYAALDLRKAEREVALKVLRHEHLELSEKKRREKYEAFVREADLLVYLQDDKRVVTIFEMGYLWEESVRDNTAYEARSVGRDVKQFRGLIQEALEQRWRPYLALERYPQRHSLHNLVVNNPRRLRLPMIEAVELSLQLTDLLVKLHQQDLIYWDAKPAHVYWDGKHLVLIDWNVSFRLSDQGLLRRLGADKEQLKKDDLVIAGRGIIYPAFVGLDFRTGTKPLSSATPNADQVRNRHAFQYRGQVELYGYEEYLDDPVRQFLIRVVRSDEYTSAEELREDLERCAVQLGWKFKDKEPHPRAVQSLRHKQAALGHLRAVQHELDKTIEELERAYEAFPGKSEDTEHLLSQADSILRLSILP